MKYFSIEELCASSTAKARKIDNTPSQEAVNNLIKLVDNVLDPLRELYGKPIKVNSGYRCPQLNKAVGGVSNSEHCFDEKTEVLTVGGWKKHNEIEEGEPIFSYSLEKDKIEIVPIDGIVRYEYSGKMMNVNCKTCDVCVTDGHRMIVKYDSHKYVRHNTKNITAEGQKYFDSLKTDNDKWHIETAKNVFGKRRFFLSAANFEGIGQNDLSLDFLKMMMAIVADGCFTTRGKYHSGFMFNFKKERKIRHIEALANRLGFHFTTSVRTYDGAVKLWFNAKVSRQFFDILGKEKRLPLWLLYLSAETQRELVFEYAFFDGSFDKRGYEAFSICSTDEKNTDVIQAMCVLSDMRCSVRKKEGGTYNIKGRTGPAKPFYIISVNPIKNSIKLTENSYKWVDYKGIVWCANNKNTTLIVRRNGKVSIQGNCYGMAADIVGTPNTTEENSKLFSLINDNFPFRQLIWEGGGRWIHISYNEADNKKQTLSL